MFFNLPLLCRDLLYVDAEVYMEKKILSLTRDGLRQFFLFLRYSINCTVTLLFFLFISFDQQSEYSVFHKLMSWQESSLWTN